jgi:predicted MFS family arabinose efflux permease
MLRSLLSPGPLACIAWSGIAHIVYYVFLTILGVWLHDSFGLDSSATGFCATLIGMGNFGGFALNLGLTDKLGARWAVLSATCAMVLVYSSLCMVTFFAPGSLPLALAETWFIFVFSEFGFLASITWATVACPKDLGVPQLTMSLAFRAAAGFGSCLGTIIALPLYECGGIALNASVAAVLHALYLLAVRKDSEKVLSLIRGRAQCELAA